MSALPGNQAIMVTAEVPAAAALAAAAAAMPAPEPEEGAASAPKLVSARGVADDQQIGKGPELDEHGFPVSCDFKTPSLAELLRISIQFSNKETLQQEAEAGHTIQESMCAETRAWLSEAMSATESDSQRIEKSMALVKDEAESVAHKEYALDLVLFFIEDIDNANDLIKATQDYVPTLAGLFSHAEPSLRMGAAWILGTLAQNNPKAQVALSGSPAGLIESLARLVREETVLEVRAKALFALSAMVRGVTEGARAALAQFEAADGSALLAELGASAPVQLRRKALFLARHLVEEHPPFAAAASAEGSALLATCVALLREGADEGAGADPDAVERAADMLEFLMRAGGEDIVARVRAMLPVTVLEGNIKTVLADEEGLEWRQEELQLFKKLMVQLA